MVRLPGLCQALVVQQILAEFTATKPQLQAEVALAADRYWHLGGFCFGHDPKDREVGLLQGRVHWAGEVPLRKANVYLAGFDGREDRWGRAARNWNSSSCQQKLEEASSYTQLQSGDFTVRILQGTGTRDWHFVLLSCGEVEAATLKLVMEAERGALSIFEANSHFHSSSCPVGTTTSWWLESRSQLGFWTVVLLALCFGSCITALVTCCISRRGNTAGREADKSCAGASEVVVGRPCEASHASHPHNNAIAKGHPHDVKMQV